MTCTEKIDEIEKVLDDVFATNIERFERIREIVDETEDKTIPIDKVKQVREEIAKYQSIHDSYCEHIEKGDCWGGHTPNHYESSGGKATACDYLLQILDKLIGEVEG